MRRRADGSAEATRRNALHPTFDWVDVEPEPGKWDWRYEDHTPSEAHKRGLEQVAFVGNTALWVLPAGVKSALTYHFPPRDELEDTVFHYCRTTVARYRGRLNRFQFWNEPSGRGGVNDGCADGDCYALYTRWLKLTCSGLNSGNPHCKIAAGALDYNWKM